MSNETKLKTQNGNTPNPVSDSNLETVKGGAWTDVLDKAADAYKNKKKKSKRRKEAK